MAGFEVLFAKLLLAIHVYCPSSFLLTLVMINCVPSSEILTLESAPAFIFVSSWYQLIVGFGFPVALHDRDVFSPSFFVSLCGWVKNTGPSVAGIRNNKWDHWVKGRITNSSPSFGNISYRSQVIVKRSFLRCPLSPPFLPPRQCWFLCLLDLKLDILYHSHNYATPTPTLCTKVNFPNHSQKHMAVCGLSLHLGNTESCKSIEQKFIFQIGTLSPCGINERFSFL